MTTAESTATLQATASQMAFADATWREASRANFASAETEFAAPYADINEAQQGGLGVAAKADL